MTSKEFRTTVRELREHVLELTEHLEKEAGRFNVPMCHRLLDSIRDKTAALRRTFGFKG